MPASEAVLTDKSSRSGDRFFNREPAFYSVSNSARMKIEATSPFRNSQCLTLKGEQSVCSRVAILLSICCPSHISRFVVSVVIWVAIYGVCFAGSRPHVSVKVEESVVAHPSVADLDSSSAVIFPALRIRIGASINHVSPDVVFRFVRHAVGSHAYAVEIGFKASAARCVFAGQCSGGCGVFVSAVALEKPERLAQSSLPDECGANACNYGPTSFALSGVVDTFVASTETAARFNKVKTASWNDGEVPAVFAEKFPQGLLMLACSREADHSTARKFCASEIFNISAFESSLTVSHGDSFLRKDSCGKSRIG